jgi:hypothetical protein
MPAWTASGVGRTMAGILVGCVYSDDTKTSQKGSITEAGGITVSTTASTVGCYGSIWLSVATGHPLDGGSRGRRSLFYRYD